jgi:hypothetical protein
MANLLHIRSIGKYVSPQEHEHVLSIKMLRNFASNFPGLFYIGGKELCKQTCYKDKNPCMVQVNKIGSLNKSTTKTPRQIKKQEHQARATKANNNVNGDNHIHHCHNHHNITHDDYDCSCQRDFFLSFNELFEEENIVSDGLTEITLPSLELVKPDEKFFFSDKFIEGQGECFQFVLSYAAPSTIISVIFNPDDPLDPDNHITTISEKSFFFDFLSENSQFWHCNITFISLESTFPEYRFNSPRLPHQIVENLSLINIVTYPCLETTEYSITKFIEVIMGIDATPRFPISTKEFTNFENLEYTNPWPDHLESRLITLRTAIMKYYNLHSRSKFMQTRFRFPTWATCKRNFQQLSTQQEFLAYIIIILLCKIETKYTATIQILYNINFNITLDPYGIELISYNLDFTETTKFCTCTHLDFASYDNCSTHCIHRKQLDLQQNSGKALIDYTISEPIVSAEVLSQQAGLTLFSLSQITMTDFITITSTSGTSSSVVGSEVVATCHHQQYIDNIDTSEMGIFTASTSSIIPLDTLLRLTGLDLYSILMIH